MISPQPATAASPATAAAAAAAASQPPWNSVLQLRQWNRLPSLQQKHQQRQERQQQKQMTWTQQHRGQMRQRKAGGEFAVHAVQSGGGDAVAGGAGAAAGDDGGRSKGEGEVQEHDGVAGQLRTRMHANDMRRVLLLWPNVVDYVRMALLACTFLLSHRHGADITQLHAHVAAVVCVYLLNFALDGVDGYIARRLNQQSSFGAFLDVVVDNTTRTLMWTRAVDGCAGVIVPCLEWLVFACTHAQAQAQVQAPSSLNTAPLSDARHLRPAVAAHASSNAAAKGGPQAWQSSAAVSMGSGDGSGVDWKANVRSGDAPPWVAAVMRNGFRTPIGVVVIAGLHFLPLWLWIVRQTSAVAAASTHHTLPTAGAASLAQLLHGLCHPLMGFILLVGRVACACVEVWVVWSHAMAIVRADGDALFGKSGTSGAQQH